VLADDDVTSSSDGFPAGASTPDSYALRVQDGQLPLTIALAFNDALALPLATSPIVNDLDLEVESPLGAIFRGNDLVDGISRTGGASDPIDNLELVKLPPPIETGDWIVRVVPSLVAVGPQAYALTAVGGPCAEPGIFAPGLARESACLALSIAAPSVGGSEPIRYSVYGSDAAGAQDFGAPAGRLMRRPAFMERDLAPGTRYYVFESVDACGVVLRSPEIAGTVTGACPLGPTLLVTKGPAGSIALAWDDASRREVLRHPVPSAVFGGPVVGSGTSAFTEPMPAGTFQFYLLR
jgi:hypothetical protein